MVKKSLKTFTSLCGNDSSFSRSVTTCKLNLVGANPPEWIELIPRGPEILALDGRKFKCSNPQTLVEKFQLHPYEIPIDWEHSSEIKGPLGEEAPAAGWISGLEVRDGSVWGKVDWNTKGAASLTNKEYRYISPAFTHGEDFEIEALVSAGLTNRPALVLQALARAKDNDNAISLTSVWSSADINDLPDSSFLFIESGGSKDDGNRTTPRSLRHFPYKDANGSIDLPHLRNAISRIPQSKISGADINKLQEKARKILGEYNAAGNKAAAHFENSFLEEKIVDKKLLELLGLKEDATIELVLSAIAALKTDKEKQAAELATARAVVPALDKFVPRAEFDVAIARAQDAEKKIEEGKKADLEKTIGLELDNALKAGKITPATVEYHKAQCSLEGGLERFKAYCNVAPVIAPDSNLDDKPKPTGDDAKLTDLDFEIAAKCGISKEKLIASVGK